MGKIVLVNSLTAARLALTFWYAVCLFAFRERFLLATALYAAICATDFLDGYLARRYRACTKAGELLDVLADLCFILASCAVLMLRRTLPVFLFGVIVYKFLEFCCTSFFARRLGFGRMFVTDCCGRLVAAAFYALPYLVPVLGHILPSRQLNLCTVCLSLLLALGAFASSWNRVVCLKEHLSHLRRKPGPFLAQNQMEIPAANRHNRKSPDQAIA